MPRRSEVISTCEVMWACSSITPTAISARTPSAYSLSASTRMSPSCGSRSGRSGRPVRCFPGLLDAAELRLGVGRDGQAVHGQHDHLEAFPDVAVRQVEAGAVDARHHAVTHARLQ